MRASRDRLLGIYQRLFAAYGAQHWWPGETPFEVIVGAILTQSAAWPNVEKAIANLKAAGALSPEGLRHLSEEELARLIYPSGYFHAKARKLKAFVALLFDRFGGDPSTHSASSGQASLRTGLDKLLAPVQELRPLLLATHHGIGPETADSILLYAAGHPVFVIDAYTRRLFARLGLTPEGDSYEAWQRLFMDVLPQEAPLFSEYHALIVRHGKEICRRLPLCAACPLLSICPTGRASGL